MKAFWRYTIARLAILGACLLVFTGIGALVFEELTNAVMLVILLVAMVVSAVISAFVLAPLRDDLARNVQERAERMSQRLEESRSAEDVD